MERYLRVSFLWRKNMATSKIKTIEKTLRKAIDYIVNPDKTNGGQLVYSHGCSVETADLEMDLTARKGTGRGSRIAYHLIQSFALDDDISPEKALELGIEFAKKVTGGNYEFIVTTHIDKDHIHNHIIFYSFPDFIFCITSSYGLGSSIRITPFSLLTRCMKSYMFTSFYFIPFHLHSK